MRIGWWDATQPDEGIVRLNVDKYHTEHSGAAWWLNDAQIPIWRTFVLIVDKKDVVGALLSAVDDATWIMIGGQVYRVIRYLAGRAVVVRAAWAAEREALEALNSNAGRQTLRFGNPTAAPAMAGRSPLQVVGQTSCFVAGTPLLTPDGDKPIEEFQVGDRVLCRPENGVEEPVEVKVVEATFVRTAPVLRLQVGGRTIRTTAEHPFFVKGKGWLCAKELQAGDMLSSHDGQWVSVEAVTDLDEVATVYNLRVSDYHTYFVGCQEWGFSVWAHNAEYAILPHPTIAGEFALAERQANGSFVWVTEHNSSTIRNWGSAADARAAFTSGGGSEFTGTVATNTVGHLDNRLLPEMMVSGGHQAPQLGVRLGQGGEGAVFRLLNEQDWVVKVYPNNPAGALEARNMLNRLDQARAVPGYSNNVVQTRPLLNPANPRAQNWVMREEVLPTNVPPNFTQRTLVEQAFQNISDTGSNLMWGVTQNNPTPRWILIE